MKTYRSSGGSSVAQVLEDGQSRELDPRLDLRNHSPTGFAWGYGGSGPSQLALAILADALGDDQRALRLYQHFKDRYVAKLPANESWSINTEEVFQIAAEIEATVTA